MRWFYLILILQLAMWASAEEPPGTMEAGPPESVSNLKETCEQSKNQLESVKDIMLRNKQSIKKKEEELQEYAKKLTKFKTRAKASRSNKNEALSSNESTPKSKPDAGTAEVSDDVVDDISLANTPQAKSSLLQKKLAEDRKIFQRRSKELTESKRAVEEKVEALRQQLEEKYVAPVSVVNPVLVTSQAPHPVLELSHMQDKDNKIAELGNKIFELEAVIIDLQENLKEKDSVIDSKTKAITLMSADLSKKGKMTLDTLEDTKDEMRSMQENFVLVESSLRNKNDNLVKQLEEKSNQISVLEENMQSLTDKLEAQKLAEVANADLSRSTMDTLTDTKDAMKSMQENFVLIETSLKSKNDHLLKQLEEREIKLAESAARILNLEAGLGIEKPPNLDNLIYKIEKLEETNRKLYDDKYELQKSIAELQDKIISSESHNIDSLLIEKDNRITELEDSIAELKRSNDNQLQELKEDMSTKLSEWKNKIEDLENEKNELETKLSLSKSEALKEDEEVQKLTKELDELNKSMIKLKAQHKNKLKNMQKQLENFKKVSDTNAELVKLGNQVTLLEEEKAAAGDWKARIADLEGKVSTQAKEIQTHIEAIAILENQKLDLMQELHTVKQEISSLEAENAESENLRVTAEMKVVDLEEELESLHKQTCEGPSDSERTEFQRQIEILTQENERLTQKLSKHEELKSSSEVGSTESFVKTGSNVDSTESFEALAPDADKADLLRKIDGLTRENGALLEKLTRYEEKGSSDTGSTESFDRIPEHGDATSRLDNLTRENYELVIKLTKLEEKLASQPSSDVQLLAQENERLLGEISQLQEKLASFDDTTRVREERSVESQETVEPSTEAPITEENMNVWDLLAKIENLTALNENLTSSLQEFEKRLQEKPIEDIIVPSENVTLETAAQRDTLSEEHDSSVAVAQLEQEIDRCKALIDEQKIAIEEMKTKLADKEAELEHRSAQITGESSPSELDENSLRRELEESMSVIAEWKLKCSEMENKLESVEHSKQQIEEGFSVLQMENKHLLEQSEHKDALVESLKEELDSTLNKFETKTREQGDIISSQEDLVRELRSTIENKDEELQAKYLQLQDEMLRVDELQGHLKKIEGQVEQRDTTIASLTEEVENLRTNSSLVEEDLFVARHQLSDLHEKLENSRSLEDYNRAIERFNDKEMLVEELEGKVNQKLVEINTLKTHLDTLVAENNELRQHLQEEERRVAEVLEGNRIQEEAMRNAERVKADVENRFLDLQATHEEGLLHTKKITNELQDAYRMMEQLKIKHTEDTAMLNQRLEEVLEEVAIKMNEVADLQNELDSRKCIPEEVKAGLEVQLADLQGKLVESEERSQEQLTKMKKYAAVAKKKTTQCEELEARLKELEDSLVEEKNEQQAKIKELQSSEAHINERDNRIVDLEAELTQLRIERDEAVGSADAARAELAGTNETMASLAEQLKRMDVVTDEARELSVRMQVMEAEYIQQLAEINSLKAENGFLVSKQTQINERLENVEKESEERRSKLEKLEKKAAVSQQACGECDTRLQALEAKLQERDAEIENLDNELHNSIGNLVLMQENLRLSTISSGQDAATMQESYNELAQRFNAVTLAHEEVKAKHEATVRDNEDLVERVARLQALNATAQERAETLERELAKDREAAASFEAIHAQYTELLERFESQRSELEAAQTRLQEATASSEASERHLLAQIELLEQEKQRLAQEYESSKQQRENIDLGDGWGADLTITEDSIALKQVQDSASEDTERQKREVQEADFFKEQKPVSLFDASIFDAPSPQISSSELQQEVRRLKDEVDFLKKGLQDAQIAAEETQRRLASDLQQAQEATAEFGLKLEETEKRRGEAEQMAASVNTDLEALHNFFFNYSHLISEWMIEGESSSVEHKLHNFGIKISEILEELEVTRADNQQLVAAQEICRKRVFELENEVKTNSDSSRIVELENRITRIISERDILQLQMNDVTRAYEDLKESSDGLRNLQSQLDAVAQERNQLVEELKVLRSSVQQQQDQISEEQTVEVAVVPQKTEEVLAESMWEDDEDPWGFGGDKALPTVSGEHIRIPVVPSVEIQLKMKVDELEDKLNEVTAENVKLVEEGNAAQAKNAKYVKKLKEYKMQFDHLQRQLKSQKSLGGFGDDLMEEEFKAQIVNLEKILGEVKEENKKVLAEKDSLLKRIDVLTAATERFTEAKEKQDVEVHVWQMRYKELEVKIQSLESDSKTKEASPPALSSQDTNELIPKYESELKELKDNIEALAAENEELQQLLEENRTKRQVDTEDTTKQVQELQEKHAELIASNDKLKSDYNNLRKQYEQGLMDANDQVQNMRQNSEILKSELVERNAESERTVSELTERLRTALEERGQLETRIQELESELKRLNFTSTSLDEMTELLNDRVQEVAGLKEELVRHQSEKKQQEENTQAHVEQLTIELRESQRQLDILNSDVSAKDTELSRLSSELQELRGLTDKVQSLEQSIEGYAAEVQEKTTQIESLLGRLNQHEITLVERDQQVTAQRSQLLQSDADLQQCTKQVQTQEDLVRELEEARLREQRLSDVIAEKETSIERGVEEIRRLQHELHSKNTELEDTRIRLEVMLKEQSTVVRQEASSTQQVRKPLDQDLPLFTFPSDKDDNKELQSLKDELRAKNKEIEELQRSINEGSMTQIVQELQDNVNTLYNDIAALEDQLSAKTQEVDALKAQLKESEHQPRKRSLVEQEEVMKLQNELHLRDQELNELKYVVSEKEAQLRGALEQATGDDDLRESSEKLKSELYGKQQELETLKFTVSELQSEIASLRGLERLAAEDRATIDKLSSEKEEVRRRAEYALQQMLQQKEGEVDNLKEQLAAANQNLMEALGLRERDIENLKIQLQQQEQDLGSEMDRKNDQMMKLESELAERDRRLAEVSITKDTEIHNMRVQLNEKNARLEELVALSEEEEKQLMEMRTLLEVKEQQINGLMSQLDEKSKEHELIQHALQRHVGNAEQSIEAQQQLQSTSSGGVETTGALSNELDLALYMLHQRDVRCEELTHELMQLLEERDTLQLRLSNALRVNEELRKYAGDMSPQKESPKKQGSSSDSEPVIENPSPSRSEGPIEIAREAINSSIGEDKKALAQKLSQLKTVDQGRDLRLRADREMRHSQQMTLLSHGDVLSQLPPEAAAKLVNANYTLSRDVQSQSSVLMNWLWGKSTPKVVHM